MPFGFQKGGSGDFLPIVKYDSRDGRISRRDSIAGAQGFEKVETDITDEFSAVMDLENIETGWVAFTATGPKKVMSRYLKEPMPERPDDKDDKGKPIYKNGFNLRMLLGKSCRMSPDDKGVYEMTGNSNMLVEAVGALHDAYTEGAAQAENRGKLPVVTLEKTVKEEITVPGQAQKQKYYRPYFAIERWVDRPEALKNQDAKPNGNGATKAFSSAPSTGSTVKAPPPVKMPKSEPEAAAADDFG